MTTHAIFLIVATIAMLPGIPLTFTPLPSLLYMFFVALGFGFIDSFTHLTGTELWILGALFVVSLIIDQLSGILGARYGGASRKSILYGILGMILGTILLPPLGGFIGLFVAIGLSEYANHRNEARALKAAAGSFMGVVVGKMINAVLAVAFLILFIIFALH